MKLRRLHLGIFSASVLTGWAAAHFTVGSAGSVALRAAVSEARMRFSDSEKESAKDRAATLAGKSIAEQAAIILTWQQLTSVAEIRHLYAALESVPKSLRHEAERLLLGRWAELDPDSLLLAGLRSGDFRQQLPMLRAFSLCWAANRSPDEIVEKLVSVAGDVRKFLPESPAGGNYRPGAILASAEHIASTLGLDAGVILELSRRLEVPLPPEGYAGVFSALARQDPQEAQRQLARVTDPDAHRAAAAGIASQLGLTDPDAALALCKSGGREMTEAVAPGYFQHLLSLPPQDAWAKAAAFMEEHQASVGAAFSFVERMAARDPDGLLPWIESLSAGNRKAGEFVLSLGMGPKLTEAQSRWLVNAAPGRLFSIIPMLNYNSNTSDTIKWAAASDRPDIQMVVSGELLRRLDDSLSVTVEDTRQLMEMFAAMPLSSETTELIQSSEVKDERLNGLAAAVSRTWPDSATLLDSLTPAAREAALPGIIKGAATIDPGKAAELLASQPDSAAATAAAASLGEAWAFYDADAAWRWAQSLNGERRDRAVSAIRPVVDSWGIGEMAPR